LIDFIKILSLNSAIRFQNSVFFEIVSLSLIELSAFNIVLLLTSFDILWPFMHIHISYLVDKKVIANYVIYLLNDLVLYRLYNLRCLRKDCFIHIILEEIWVVLIFLYILIKVQFFLSYIYILLIIYKFI